MTRILSFGGGVNSTALLALAYLGKVEVDEVVFADTGAELPETYEHIRRMKRVCREIGIPFTTVRGKEKGITNLYDYCLHYRIIPLREYRWCTDKFKVRPIASWVKGKEKKKKPVMLIGFDANEGRRIERHLRFYPFAEKEFPLFDMKITRRKCKDIIRRAGWDVPVRSGCFFCPFKPSKYWRWLLDNHPDLFNKARELEENSRKYPDTRLYRIPLKDVEKRWTNTRQTLLFS